MREINQESLSEDLKFYLCSLNGMFRHIWIEDYSSPITEMFKEGINVLDVGCGLGVWVKEMVKKYPKSQYIGIESVPISQEYKDLAPEAKFLQCNLIDRLPFEDNSFDYVHCRNANMDFSAVQWTEILVPEIIRVTKPNGFIEHGEVDEHHVNEGPIMKEITDAISTYNASREIDGMIGEKLDAIFLKTGLLYNIHHQQKYGPMGRWGGEYGELTINIFAAKCRHLKNQLAEVMNITPEEFDKKIELCIEEGKSTRTYLKSHRIYAQKI